MLYLIVYLVGVVIGVGTMRDRWPSRLLTALVWPLGPVAFVLVTCILFLASAVLWPGRILGSAAVLGAIAWLLVR